MIDRIANTMATQHNYYVPWFMYAILVAVLFIYALIEWLHVKHDHTITTKEATIWSIGYIVTALLFAIPVFFFISPQASGEYIAGWAIEKALSLDNLFVIGLIFVNFKIPPSLERRMLNYGIAGAIVFRLIFILLGYELLSTFSWISIFFGLILLKAAINAYKDARKADHKEELAEEQKIWKFLTKHLPIHSELDGHRLTTKINGKRVLTLMAGVIILIEISDIIFAVDSVPAVLAVSPNRFIAYSSNIFALLGLRALFFVYQSIADKFWALELGLAGILGWISFKMIIAPDSLPFGIPWFGIHTPVALSLAILAILLFGSILISMIYKQPSKLKQSS